MRFCSNLFRSGRRHCPIALNRCRMLPVSGLRSHARRLRSGDQGRRWMGGVCTDYAPVSANSDETPEVGSDPWDYEDVRGSGRSLTPCMNMAPWPASSCTVEEPPPTVGMPDGRCLVEAMVGLMKP